MKNNLFRTLVIGVAALGLASPLLGAHLTGLTLYGVTVFGNQLVAINPATGDARVLGTTAEPMSAFGIAARNNRLYTFDQVSNRIREINKINGSIKRTIDINLPSRILGEGDITFRADGVGFLAAALNSSAQPTNDLYMFKIDDTTNLGVSTRIGSTSVPIDAMAFNAAGTLYALGEGDATLYTINTTTGVATPVGPLGVTMNNPISGMTFAPVDPQGVQDLYASIDDRLFKINTATGAATPVSTTVLDFGVSSVSGLVFTPGAGTVGNMSTRIVVGTGDNVGIGGFFVRGTPGKKVVLRGIGPSIRGLSNTLADPTIELFDSQMRSLGTNDNWMDTAGAAEIQSLGLAPSNPKESALLRTLNDGAYTVVIKGVNGTSGLGLVEIYDADLGSGSRLANISSRGFVRTGDSVLIGGLIVSGSATQRIVVRAIGPDLTRSGVPNALSDPLVDVRDANGMSIGTNDNFGSGPDVAELAANGLTPGDPRDAALIVNTTAGNYTAIVTGVNSTGVGLVEFYNLTNVTQ
ncbi:MAG: hypothetical protein M3Y80_05385 [Verrucomicrobiota bacterium]|nr:hypothetical protein [Verrucomicrobiota bacterium]